MRQNRNRDILYRTKAQSGKLARARCSSFKNKAAAPGRVHAAQRPTINQHDYTLHYAVWILSYELEKARQSHVKAGHSFRHWGCSTALAALRMAGGRA